MAKNLRCSCTQTLLRTLLKVKLPLTTLHLLSSHTKVAVLEYTRAANKCASCTLTFPSCALQRSHNSSLLASLAASHSAPQVHS